MTARPSFVVLVGLDGTGKSTQAERLRAWLAGEGLRPTVVHHGSPLSGSVRKAKARLHQPLIARFKQRGIHRDHAAGARAGRRAPDAAAAGAIATAFITAGFLKSWYHRARHRSRTLVYDRSFLDDIVKAEWRFASGWALGSRLLRFVPKPDVVIRFVLDPAIAYSRKKARTCEPHELVAKAVELDRVIALARQRGWKVVDIDIDGRSPDEVFERVRRVIDGETPA